MQTTGEEQNFQTLFCEMRLEDERLAPRFSVVWNGAQASTRSRRGFKFEFVACTVLVLISLFSLALWFGSRSRSEQQYGAIVIPAAGPSISIAPLTLEPAASQPPQRRVTHRAYFIRRAIRLAERRRLMELALWEAEFRNVVAVSSWQSPTAMLMQSPADDLLESLPQLYRSVTELNSFLPDTQK